MTRPDPVRARTLVSLAESAQAVADQLHGLVGDTATSLPRGGRIRKARRIRIGDLTVLDLAVLAELAEGATWEEIAAALGEKDAETARRRYEHTWEQWRDEPTNETAVADSAHAVDLWWRRHLEPWDVQPDPAALGPAEKVLVERDSQ